MGVRRLSSFGLYLLRLICELVYYMTQCYVGTITYIRSNYHGLQF